MPVILSPADYDVWLNPSVQEALRLQPFLRPYPPEEMEAYPVSTRVNNPANGTRECIESSPGQGGDDEVSERTWKDIRSDFSTVNR